MPTKSTKSKGTDSNDACAHLETLNEVSYSLQPLCHCKARDLVLGQNALVCSVCQLFKKSDNQLGEMYVADALDAEDMQRWDDEDFYEVIKDEDEDEEEDEEDDDMPKKRRVRKKKVVEEEEEEDEEDDEEEKKKKAAEEGKISEELFGRKEEEVEEPEVEDLEKEIHEVYDRKERKLAKAREKGIDVENDDDLDLIDDLDEDDMEEQLSEVKKTSKGKKAPKATESSDLPEVTIEVTKDGKQRCPRCNKEFASVARHITRCKYAQGQEDIDAIKLASSKLKK